MTVDTFDASARVDSWVNVVRPVAELAASIADTELVPVTMRRRPDVIAAVILYGRELDLPPMTALRTIYLVEGRPALYAEAQLALVLRAGHSVEYVESTSARCVVRGRRQSETGWHEVTWTLEDARRAGLNGKAWTKYPRAMLKHRATAELARDLFPDVTSGMSAVEELEDEPESVAPSDVAQGARSTVRRKRSATVEQPTPIPSETPVPLSVPIPATVAEPDPEPIGAPTGEPTDEVAEALARAKEHAKAMLGAHEVEDVDLPAEPPAEPYTAAQRAAMHAAFNELGITDRQARLDYTSALIRRDIKSANELSSLEATAVLDALRLARDADEPLAMLDEARRGWGLVVDEPMPWPDDVEP